MNVEIHPVNAGNGVVVATEAARRNEDDEDGEFFSHLVGQT